MKYFIAGIITILTSIWGGALAVDYFTNIIFEFAAFTTAVLGFVGGTMLLGLSIE